MRKFYKYTEEQVIEVVNDNKQRKTAVAVANELVVSGSAILYDTFDELKEVIQYRADRRNEYPDIEEQLDKMYHDGFDAWKVTIKAVKDAHPKPE
tara:strand:- start:11 stop:295 length:285 start_codon:yes stop_codon:yes gene_type:complete